jgi:integrase
MARWGIYDLNVWHTLLSSVAPSTKQAYEKIFLDFVSFFDENDCTFDSVQIDSVLSFLQRFVGLSKSRIRTVVAALKMFLRVYRRSDLADHSLLTLFAKGAQNLAPLPKEKMPIWNPDRVMSYLSSRPRPEVFLAVASEALILLLLATGWRVDDVWKLSANVVFSDEKAVFFFIQKRKCPIKGSYTLSRAIPRFKERERICPVKSIEFYLLLAQKLRKDFKPLFISSTGLRASKDSLRRWVVELLGKCGISASAGSCRSAATSSALLRNWSIDQILNSAGWSSESTFRKYYDRSVLKEDAPVNLLQQNT